MRQEGGREGGRGREEASWESRATGLELVVSENPCLNFLQPAPNCVQKVAGSSAFICLDHKLWKICFESCFHRPQNNNGRDFCEQTYPSGCGGSCGRCSAAVSGVPYSTRSTCRWFSGCHRSRNPWHRAWAPGSGWSLGPSLREGERERGVFITTGEK